MSDWLMAFGLSIAFAGLPMLIGVLARVLWFLFMLGWDVFEP